MLEEIVAPNVEHERDLGLHRGDVGKILIGPDADVGAAVDVEAAHRIHHVQVRRFVRHDVFRLEESARLGELPDQVTEGRFGRDRGRCRRRLLSSRDD